MRQVDWVRGEKGDGGSCRRYIKDEAKKHPIPAGPEKEFLESLVTVQKMENKP